MSRPEPTAPHGKEPEPGVQHEEAAKVLSPQEATRQMPPVEESPATTASLPKDATDILDHAAETEEVYVILPEGEMNSIPVVETQAVEEAPTGHLTHTQAVETSSVETSPVETAQVEQAPVRFKSARAAVGPRGATEEIRETDEMSAPKDSENLDQLALGLEDELLSGKDAEVAESDLSLEESEQPLQEELSEEAVTAEALDEEVGEQLAVRGRSAWKVLLPLAAAMALAAGGYFFYPEIKGYLGHRGGPVVVTAPGHVGSGPATGVGTPPKLPVPGAGGPVAVPGAPVGSGGGSAGGPATVPGAAKEAKDAFREKFLLAMELGFVGEVPNE